MDFDSIIIIFFLFDLPYFFLFFQNRYIKIKMKIEWNQPWWPVSMNSISFMWLCFFLSSKIFIKWFTRISNLMLIVKYNYHDFFFREPDFFKWVFLYIFFSFNFWFNLVDFCPCMLFILVVLLLITVIISMWFCECERKKKNNIRSTMIMIMNASHMHIMLSNRFQRKKHSDKWMWNDDAQAEISSQLSEMMSMYIFLLYVFISSEESWDKHQPQKMTKGTRKPYGIQMRRFVDTLIF